MHIHRRKILRKAVLCCAAAALLASGAASAEEERPRIFLEKRILADSSGGKKSFYEVHTVVHGENLWKILNRKEVLSPAEYTRMLREFQRANPGVTDLGKLKEGRKILVPSAVSLLHDSRVVEGRAVPHRVERGDTLTRLLAARGVARRDIPRYLDAIKKMNESVRDVNRIIAGSTILLPSDRYFDEDYPKEAPTAALGPLKEVTPAAVTKTVTPPIKEAPPAILTREVPPAALTKEVPPAILTREVPQEPVKAADAPAKPEAQLPTSSPTRAIAPVVEVRPDAAKAATPRKEEPVLPSPKPPYRGLLTDLLAGLGEKMADRGTLYLPVPSGGEVVLNLEDFPVARFSNGNQVLIDFRGSLPENIRTLIMQTWKSYRVISMDGTGDPWEMIRRLLQASGYHSVKDGLAHPLVVGEGVSVTLPARWVVLRTPESLLSGEVILVKEVPEKPTESLAAVLLFADRVGIRVLPFATDTNALEGFMVGIGTPGEAGVPPPRQAVPADGLPALDFALDFLGIPRKEGERLKISGKGDAFQLIVQPDRLFEAGGNRHVTDTGRMAPALRTLLRDSGYKVFPVLKKDSGRDIFQRVLNESGISFEVRKEYLVSGGEKEGYAVRVTGTFITSKEWLKGKKAREAVLYGGRTHSATRALMRDLGVEIVEW